MISIPAAALELGNLNTESSLGQPLRASIAYALHPNEQLYDFCVYLRPGLAANGLPVLSKASVSIADGIILLTGSRAIREPMLTMQVSIDCPYTAHISREYTIMLNPPTPVVEVMSLVEPSVTPVAQTTTAEAPKPRAPVEARRNIDESPVAESSRHLVQRGESLSEIASRIADRSIALWPAVDRIFAANPDAFMDGDMNRLKAGSWLDIPDLSATADISTAAEPPVVAVDATPLASVTEDFTANTGYEAAEPIDVEVIPTQEPVVMELDTAVSEYANLQPGDVVVGNDKPFVSPIDAADSVETIMIPDTEIVEPTTRSYQP